MQKFKSPRKQTLLLLNLAGKSCFKIKIEVSCAISSFCLRMGWYTAYPTARHQRSQARAYGEAQKSKTGGEAVSVEVQKSSRWRGTDGDIGCGFQDDLGHGS